MLLAALQQKLLDSFLAAPSTDNPHKSRSEGRQKCCGEGMGFWSGLKSDGSIGRSAGAGLWARYRLCRLREGTLGQAGPDSARGCYPAPLEERVPLGMLLASVGPLECFAGRDQGVRGSCRALLKRGRRNAVHWEQSSDCE